MTELYNNILCITGGWLFESGVMSVENYRVLTQRGILKTIRRGCRNTPSLIDYHSIPERFRVKIVEKLGGDPEKIARRSGLSGQINPDYEARTYFSNYKLSDGRTLTQETINEYCANAEILNALTKVACNQSGKRRALGNRGVNIWENLAIQVSELKVNLPHSLPENFRRLKEKWEKYRKEGYLSLVHKGFLNDNSRKVSDRVENLILSLYAHKNRPYGSSVHDMYMQFLGGALEVIDLTTGEILDRNDYFDEKGNPAVISESTVWNYLNNPKNRLLVDKIRSGRFEFTNLYRPHYHRHSPFFALSKISMDDRDLPRKMPDGTRVKAYYAYDVASGAVIGASYSRAKDTNLFLACVTDMFRFIERERLGMPLEVEVEHHLVNQFDEDLMKAGVVFPFVRWCAPGNSQEKRAEHFNKAKKYGYEKRYQDGIGRWYAKQESNRVNYDKIPSESNDTYKEKYYSFEDLVADDLEIIRQYNNDLHPKKHKYAGMTRMDVLRHHANPDAKPIRREIIIRYIGEHTATSIRRNQYMRVKYNDYMLPTPEVLKRLAPNNYTVDCYYLPDENGDIPEVYMFQENQFLSVCRKIKTFNEATVEQTDADREAMTEQAKYVSRFDKMVKEGVNGFAKIKTEDMKLPAADQVKVAEVKVDKTAHESEQVNGFDGWDESTDYYSTRGFDSL